MIEQARAYVDSIAVKARERFTGPTFAHLAVGEPGREILQLATDVEADLIVVGSHGKKTLERMLVGSVSQSVVQKARCAVLVARPKEYPHDDVPEIEPACAQCLEVQRMSRGAELWCAEHSTRHVHGRLHYEVPASYGVGSMLIRPEG